MGLIGHIAKIRALLKGPKAWVLALAVAGVSDLVSLPSQFALPLQVLIDLATALALFLILGRRWALLSALVVEAIPGLATLPAWTMVVLSLAALEGFGVGKGLGPDKEGKAMAQGKGTQAKVLNDWQALAAEVAAIRARGGKVVFTNGVFDLLHIGHLRYLEQARGLGEALVVAINSDASVRALKGPARPILPEEERAELLAGLACVSFVTRFSEPDPRACIAQVRPNVLVKGGDWPVEKILGADTVLADGGQVLSLPFVPGRSTTSIVESIRERYSAGFKE